VTSRANEVSSDAGSSRTAAMAAAAFLKVAGKPNNAEKAKEEEVGTEDDGHLSIEVAERTLRWHAEAIGRCVELSAPAEVYV
jgi:exocyst complex component 5